MSVPKTMKPTGRSFAGLAFVVCLGAMTWACGSRTPPAAPLPQPASRAETPKTPAPAEPSPPSSAATTPLSDIASGCGLISEPGEPVATVALVERVDPANAPNPSNESERLLFRQLYETLVRVDCGGRVGPGLAASWRLDPGGRTWIVTLREDARFSDGTPVTSADVVSSWTRGDNGDDLRPRVSRLVRSVVLTDDRTLAITLRTQRVDAPLALAHTDLAVARRVPGSRWPLGTQAARIAPDLEASRAGGAGGAGGTSRVGGASGANAAAGNGSSVITLIRVPAGSSSFDTTDDRLFLRFLVAPDRDQRDLLDEGVDLLLTRDPAALDYAATLPQFLSVPQEWRQVHVFLTPGGALMPPSLSPEARQALADDAIRGEARGALDPFWWQMLTDCDVVHPEPKAQLPPLAARIVYDRDDGAARDLAERFVGLASRSGPGSAGILDALLPNRSSRTGLRATPLTGQALAAARQGGTDAGYVVSLDRRPLEPCAELQDLVDGARWLAPEAIVPLIDTRLQAIVRRGRSGVSAEWDGGLIIRGAGR